MAIAPYRNYPGMALKVGFAGTPLRNPRNSAPTWTDLSTRVMDVEYEIGWPNSNLDASPQVTMMSVTLLNQDRALDRLNTASAYYPNVLPLRPVVLDWIWSGTTYAGWTGIVDEWVPNVTMEGIATMEMVCFDRLGLVAQARIPPTPSEAAGDTPATRLARILTTKLGWSGLDYSYVGQQSQSYMAPTTWGQTALTHLDDCRTVEGGQSYLFMRPNGNVVLTGRNDIRTNARMNTQQVTFTSDSSTGLRFSEISFRDTREDLRNHAIASRENSTRSYVYQSTANQTAFFTHSTEWSGVPARNSGDVEAAASWRVYYLKSPRFRVEGATVQPLNPRNASHAIPKLLNMQVGDRTTIEWRPKGSAQQYNRSHWITGWRVRADPNARDWTVRVKFDPADDLYISGGVSEWGVVGSANSGFRLGV